jgi:hypothetical protein
LKVLRSLQSFIKIIRKRLSKVLATYHNSKEMSSSLKKIAKIFKNHGLGNVPISQLSVLKVDAGRPSSLNKFDLSKLASLVIQTTSYLLTYYLQIIISYSFQYEKLPLNLLIPGSYLH